MRRSVRSSDDLWNPALGWNFFPLNKFAINVLHHITRDGKNVAHSPGQFSIKSTLTEILMMFLLKSVVKMIFQVEYVINDLLFVFVLVFSKYKKNITKIYYKGFLFVIKVSLSFNFS